MSDGTVSTHDNLPAELLHKNGAPLFSLNGKNYELGNKEGYRRPPKAEYRDYLIECGHAGYVALYEIEAGKLVTILAVRHQREDDYH